jgi:cytochrome c-type biogenesis protein CcmH/NrfG
MREKIGIIVATAAVAAAVGAGATLLVLRAGTAPDGEPPNAAGTTVTWPTALAVATSSGATAQAGTTRVAPVDSLVGGLEARLAQNPRDANGWALLAQSYAFLGNAAAAERAMLEAVALGVDEPQLRERVGRAERVPHSGDWIEATLRESRARGAAE